MRASFRLRQLALLLAIPSACTREEAPPEVREPEPARILRFETSAAGVAASERVAITWKTQHAALNRIETSLGVLILETREQDGVADSPPLREDTTFVLHTKNDRGDEVTASVDVAILDEPGEVAIVRFTASPLTVFAGDPVTLSWEVASSILLEIDAAGGRRLMQTATMMTGAITVHPEATTTYRLTAHGSGDMRPKTLEVAVTVDERPTDPPPPVDGCIDMPRGARVGWFAEVMNALPRPIVPPSIAFFGSGGGVADLDGDGLLDLVIASRGAPVTLLRNRGDLQFEELPSRGGVDSRSPSAGVALGDLDGDGDPDLILLGTAGALVYENMGGAQFRRAGAPAFEMMPGAESALLADLDHDRRLDVLLNIFGRELTGTDDSVRRDQLFRNAGAFVLEDITATAGVEEHGQSWTSSMFDANGDGLLDVYIANDTFSQDYGGGVVAETMLVPDAFYVNRGVTTRGLRLEEASVALALDARHSSMGGITGDFDGDGVLDLYISNLGKNPLYLGRPDQPFVEKSEELGVAGTRRNSVECEGNDLNPECLLVSWGAVFEDFDNDGAAELLVANGGLTGYLPQPTLLFVRTPGPAAAYEERDPAFGCFDGRVFLPGDFDNDGDLDLVAIPRNGEVRIFETHAPSEHGWLRVKLEGRASNREGRGAIVTLELDGGETMVRPIGAGGVVHSSLAPEAHFGLGAKTPLALRIRWPSGQVQIVSPVARDQIISVVEPD